MVKVNRVAVALGTNPGRPLLFRWLASCAVGHEGGDFVEINPDESGSAAVALDPAVGDHPADGGGVNVEAFGGFGDAGVVDRLFAVGAGGGFDHAPKY